MQFSLRTFSVVVAISCLLQASHSDAATRWLSLATLSTSDGRHRQHRQAHTSTSVSNQRRQPNNYIAAMMASSSGVATAVSGSGSSGGSNIENSPAVCDHFIGLSTRQRRICRRDVDNMRAVRQGALLAIEECQQQFSRRRWNCSVVDSVNVFGKVVATGTREAAFVHAISSAGVVFAITRSCSSGQLDRCGCDRTIKVKAKLEPNRQIRSGAGGGRIVSTDSNDVDLSAGDDHDIDHSQPDSSATTPGHVRVDSSKFHWAGCSDNIEYGMAFAKSFVDAGESGKGNRTDRTLVNLHNNNAGRQIVADNVRVRCKCHGVSGSCEVRTCWRTVPTMRLIGEALLEKYDTAVQVSPVKSDGAVIRLERSPGYMAMLMHRTGTNRRHTTADLPSTQHRLDDDAIAVVAADNDDDVVVVEPTSRPNRRGGGGGQSPLRLRPTGSMVQVAPVASSELVYLEASPDFCEPDDRTGAPGTVGRRCNRTSSLFADISSGGLMISQPLLDTDSCDVMCCGRGYVTQRRTEIEKCHCRFHWCCAVRCQRCKTTIEENICR